MVFNGEMYNYEEVKVMLPDYPFKTTSDTEVLIAAYAKWGIDCLKHFRGMFAFAIWDRQEQDLVLVRDRLGVKPLYYFQEDGVLLFASEVRSILASGMVRRQLNETALLDYFHYQSVSYPNSLVRGIQQLEAGSWIRIKGEKAEKRRYWDVSNCVQDFDFSDKGLVRERIKALLLQSVQRRLVSDVPVGAFLSGGIDSSAVVGLMAEASSERPNTFNISFEEKEYDESYYAELIARKFNTRHTRILLKPTVFLDELQNALDAMDTPSGDGVNSYVVSKEIRQGGMTVALSGVGGDELFAGYPFFNQFLQLQAYKSFWKAPLFLRKAAAAVLGGSGEGKWGKAGQLLRLPSVEIEETYPVFRQILSPRLLRELTLLDGTRNSPECIDGQLRARSGSIHRLPLLSQVSVAEYLGYTQHTLLKDTDQMGMAASLEVREPFFDQDLLEFVLAIPDRLKKPAYPKSLLVESLKPLLPDEVVHRRKQGFLFPWPVWLRNELRSFGEGLIHRMAGRPFVNGDKLLNYWQRFQAGDKNVRWSELWLFIVLEYWLEKNKIEC